jgi:Rrf2 family protein
MPANSRFAVAVHIMGLLTAKRGEVITSDRIAASVNTNPVVVRRLLTALAKAGLVRCRPGATGGSRLARRPERITLLEIYRAAGAGERFALPHRRPDPRCPVGCNVQAALRDVLDRAEAATAGVFADLTLYRFTRAVLNRPRRTG